MYSIYKELHPPTGVEHCLQCHFVDLHRENLVVASTTSLSVYEIKDQVKNEVGSPTNNKEGKGKLVQIGEFHLHGHIQGMEKVQLTHSQRSSLLLTFKDAKVAIVEYDPENNGLKTISLHQFEDDELRGGLLHNPHRPVVRVDPEGRCAAILAYGRYLAVIPFQQEAILDEHEPTSPITPQTGESQDILPSKTIDLLSFNDPIINVKDFTFVHGYNSPTLFILYEPNPTWAGRISLRKDTMSVAALSINPNDRVHPIIWSVSNLPFDCSYFLPVPQPLGGVLVFAANCLIYLNQSTPPYGISFNSIAQTSTRFLLKSQNPDLKLTMDCSQAVMISPDQVLVSLRTGDVYLLTLLPDSGMRGLKYISIEKNAASVLASCMCTVGEKYLFLGSRLGNSLLLKITRISKEESTSSMSVKSEEMPGAEIGDTDDLMVYGASGTNQSGSSSGHTSYCFEVCDSLVNIGPIVSATVGEPAFLSEEFMEKADPDLELVLCSGHGKNGSLSVLQHTIRPQVVTTFELPGCTNMWTVLSETKENQKKEEHAFLILSRQESTMVLQTGQEITELDNSGFATQSPTVFAGNIGQERYIVQATCTDIRLLKGVKQLYYGALDMGGGIRSCDICSPYITILLNNGTVGVLELTATTEGEGSQRESAPVTLKLSWPEIEMGSKIVCISAYTDHSGLFTTCTTSPAVVLNKPNKKVEESRPSTATPPSKRPHRLSLDEEDQLLYGDVEHLTKDIKQESRSLFPGDNVMEEEEEPMEVSEPVTSAKFTPTQFCSLVRDDGALEIYQLPAFTLVFAVRNFAVAPHTLCDSGRILLPSPHPNAAQTPSNDHVVDEMLLTGLGPDQTHPFILAIINKELVVYKAYPYHLSSTPGHLQLRFSKVHHSVLLNDRRGGKIAKHLQKGVPEDGGKSRAALQAPRFRVFRDIAGYSGVFVCGAYPHWLFLTQRGALRLHPMFIDGPVRCFSVFNNVNCPQGFLFFNKEGELRICVLPSYLSYDSHWPVRKVPLKATPHFVGYHMESRTHVVVTSESIPATVIPQVSPEDTEQYEPIERDSGFVLPMQDDFYIQLYSPNSWELVPNSRSAMERFERVTAMKVMQLRSQETLSGKKEFIVTACTAVFGEDISTKGKITISDVIEVNPEPGKPLTKHKLKVLYSQEQKWPVTGLECVDGLILTCMGQKIFMWQFKDKKDLLGIAFIDAEVYIHSAKALKNFILTADVHRSVQLLRYQENRKTLSLISQDRSLADVYACEYVIDGQQLGYVASDSDKNIVLFQYQPELPESQGGMFLVRQGEFYAGTHINVFFRIRCKTSAGLGSSQEMKIALADKRHITFFGTLDGGLGYLLPVPEKVYRRLSMLQIKMVHGIPHDAGLNPKAFRSYHSRHQFLHASQRTILDGELLWKYVSLSSKEKTDFAKQIGTSPGQILEDLKEIDKVTAHF